MKLNSSKETGYRSNTTNRIKKTTQGIGNILNTPEKPSDEFLEQGQKFGLKNSNDFQKIYHDSTHTIITWAKQVLSNKDFCIADYGGGNSIVSRELINSLCKEDSSNFTVDNIDIDRTKFVNYKHLFNIFQDVLTYKPSKSYDLSLCRLLLHYFDKNEQKKLIKNIYSNTNENGYLILGNFVADDEESYAIKRKILDYIEKYKGIKSRIIPKTKEIEELIIQTGFKIMKEKKISYSISLADFYKNRFGLSPKDMAEIANLIGTDSHQESQIFILAQKS